MPESLLSEFPSCSFIKKETSAQVSLSEFYEIFKNTYFLMLLPYLHLQMPLWQNSFAI